MPDPRDHEEGYTRVRTHYRRKPTPQGGDGHDQLGCILMLFFFVVVPIMVVGAVVWYTIVQLGRTWHYWLGPVLVVIVVIVYFLLKLMRRHSPERRRGIKRVLDTSFLGCLVIPPIGCLIASICYFASSHLDYGIFFIVMAVTASVIAIIENGRYKHDTRQREAEGELDKHIQTALRKMESVNRYYTDEDNANQQLCLMLRELMPGVDVRLMKPGSAEGDIRVANTIIEGKLDLETKDEMDRLVGQLQDYCSSTSCEVRVVVYGRLRPDFRRRIEGLPQYPDRILLHHIKGIRTRKPTGKRYTVIEQTDDD